jgi:hypothetical protein
MLPAVAPNARILRYGYQSQWFGKEMMQQSVSTVAKRLLRALKRTRKVRTAFGGCWMPAKSIRMFRSGHCCL